MKNLWKYLSTLGLLLVACLCLGVGLKTAENVTAKNDVCIDNGATYTMTGGNINSVWVNSGTFTMTEGRVNNVSMSSSGTCIYNGGTINEVSFATGGIFELKKEPTSLITITTQRISTAGGSNLEGVKVAKVSKANFSLTNIKVNDLSSIYDIGVSYVDGAYWIVVVQNVPNYTVTIKTNNSGGYVSQSSITVPSGTTFSVDADNDLVFSSFGYYVTATAYSGYRFAGWSPASGTVTSDMTIYANFSQNVTTYKVTISAGSGGRVSQTSVDIPSETTYWVEGNVLYFSDGTTITATANTGYAFESWSSNYGTITKATTIRANFVISHIANIYFDLNYAYIPVELSDKQWETYGDTGLYKYTFDQSVVGTYFSLRVGDALTDYYEDLYDEQYEYTYWESSDREAWFYFGFCGEIGYEPIFRKAYFFQELVGTKLLNISYDMWFVDLFEFRCKVYDAAGELYDTTSLNLRSGSLNMFEYAGWCESDVDIYVELVINEATYENLYSDYGENLLTFTTTNPNHSDAENEEEHIIKILKDDYYTFSDQEICMLVQYAYELFGAYPQPSYSSMEEILALYDEYVNSGQIIIDTTGIEMFDDSEIFGDYWGSLDSMYPAYVDPPSEFETSVVKFYEKGYDLYFSNYFYYYSSLTVDLDSSEFYLPEYLSCVFENCLDDYYGTGEESLEFKSIIRAGTLRNHKAWTERYWDNWWDEPVVPSPGEEAEYEKYYTRDKEVKELEDTRIFEYRSELFIQSPIDLSDEMVKVKQDAITHNNTYDWWREFIRDITNTGTIDTICIDILTFIQTFCANNLESYEFDEYNEVLTLHFGWDGASVRELFESTKEMFESSGLMPVIVGEGELATLIDDYTLEIYSEPRGNEYKDYFVMSPNTILMTTNLKWLSESAATYAQEEGVSYTYMFNLVGIPYFGANVLPEVHLNKDRYESLYKYDFVLINNFNLKYKMFNTSREYEKPIAAYILQAQLASQNYATLFEDKYKYFEIFYDSIDFRTAQYAKFIQ